MPTFAFLDVAIGLVFVFLIMSLMACGLLEILAGYLKFRSRVLKDAIYRLLDCGETPNGAPRPDIARAVMEHGLVRGLQQGEGRFIKSGPSYIPSRIFMLALCDAVQKTDAEGKPLGMASSVESLPDSPLKDVLRTLMDDAGGDVAALRKGIESWYDDAMDRVSGWYKRRSQIWLLVIGFLMAASMNVDAFDLGKRLWNDPAVRASLVLQAEKMAQSNPDLANADIRKLVEGADLPVGEPWGDPAAAHIPGWLVTAIAISFGAPFWLNSLNALLSIRSAGVKPGRSNSAVPGTGTDPQSPPPAAVSNAPVIEGRSDPAGRTAFEKSVGREDLMDIQMVLGLKAKDLTGTFSPATRDAIAAFQEKHGLPKTGVLELSLANRIMRV